MSASLVMSCGILLILHLTMVHLSSYLMNDVLRICDSHSTLYICMVQAEMMAYLTEVASARAMEYEPGTCLCIGTDYSLILRLGTA